MQLWDYQLAFFTLSAGFMQQNAVLAQLSSGRMNAAWKLVALLRCGKSTGALCSPLLQCTQGEAGKQAAYMPPGAPPPLPWFIACSMAYMAQRPASAQQVRPMCSAR